MRTIAMKYWVIIMTLFAFACSSEKKEKVDQNITKSNKSELLLGSWKNSSMIVRMPDSTLIVPEGRWEEVLGIKPIVTIFNEDGSYVSEYRTPEDSVFMTRAGAWVIEGDSLLMIDGEVPNKYHFEIISDTVYFTGYLDWNQNGSNDDHYAGKQVRIE